MLDTMLSDRYPKVDTNKISLYKRIAIDKVKSYFFNSLNIEITEDRLEIEYVSALFLLISNSIDYEESKGIKSIKQGNKQVSYNTYENKQFVLTDEIKDMFPLPRIKFKG